MEIKFKPRLYQQTIFGMACEKNTLIVLPTGLGKTFIFLMLAIHSLKQNKNKKVLFLGPTKPLVAQYAKVFKEYSTIPERDITVFTGEISPVKRTKIWKEKRVVFSTPQGIENDIISDRIDLKNVDLVGFDEAHRAVGNYSYVGIAAQIKKKSFARVVALTASPGSDIEKVNEVCDNLFIENIEVRKYEDLDVSPYIKEIKLNWEYVTFSTEFSQIQKHLKTCLQKKITSIRKYHHGKTFIRSKTDMIRLRKKLVKQIDGQFKPEIMISLSLVAEAMKVDHALGLLESQGLMPLIKYMESINSFSAKKTKAAQNLSADTEFKSALVLAKELKRQGIIHPKLEKLRELLKQHAKNSDIKIIIFSQFRDSIVNIIENISDIEHINAKMFVGQAKKNGTGLTQKEQLQIINDFKKKQFNTIIMSSVGEEGLDIPEVDVVIFYEPVPSAIRTIQRRGRTGRQKKGEVIVLMTKKSRDESYKKISEYKENRMHQMLKQLDNNYQYKNDERKKNVKNNPIEKKLADFPTNKNNFVVIADYREKGSGVVKKLLELGATVKLEKLEIGD